MEKITEKLEEHTHKIILSLIGLVIILLGFVFWQWSQPETKEITPSEDLLEELIAEESENTQENGEETVNQVEVTKEIVVDVKGAVHAPGVYTMSDTHRVIDAIKKAGGFSEEAEQNAVNLAKVVEDQMVIYIPKIGEEDLQIETLNQANVGGDEAENGRSTIDINHADKEALMTLNGIGNSKADAILSYREESGRFQTIEEIKNVSGIGDATFENLKENITVSP